MNLAVRAAGAILQYLAQTQPAALKLLDGLSTYNLSEFMTLDAATRRNLELTETLRGGSAQRLAIGCPGPYDHPDGQTPDPPVGEQTAAEMSNASTRQEGVAYFFENGMLRARAAAPT